VPKISVSQAKNLMRRAIGEIRGPGPSRSEIDELWAFFESGCAYCGVQVERRSAHLDHADPLGGNRVGNRVLSCGRCNGDEKRERGWLEFLNEKASGAELSQRKLQIEKWMARHPHPEVRRASEEVLEQERLLEDLVTRFGKECAKLRRLMKAKS